MKRITLAAVALATVSLFAAGCGSDSDTTSAPTSAAATSEATDLGAATDAATTGDTYTDTCNGVLNYVKTLQASGLTDGANSPQAIGEEFVNLAKTAPDWASKSDKDKADFERGVTAGVAGKC
ncbi:hypothetical protein FK531_03865 [Rhodococcus spelaei]|uniref:Lipoprotein n=1 Tax=Rhodococcus spelaei TaxID=2546320 RepID=A0A541BSD2_9NOCA|nr:hypothetical protein [Rhodococcus spelaei]TQF75188.1 hypothetical protein FK531_03865 [Rhodococcus spelaei]